MSTGDDLETPTATDTEGEGDGATVAAEPKTRLDLDVQISDVGPCKKHVKVTIPRSDIEKQFQESLGTMAKEAFVPGFRPGHAPKQLVERRYRKEVAGQVKSTLLMASLGQIDEEHKLNPISEPQMDVGAIELPNEGPMSFEMDVEVRPDFKLPAYKALSIKVPTRTVTENDIEAQVKAFRERYAQVVPRFEGGAEPGDYVTADLLFTRDGQPQNEAKEIKFRLQSELRFQDGSVPDLEKALVGVKPGESRTTDALIGSASADPNLRGQTIQVTFNVLDLKSLRLPEMDAAFWSQTGFTDEADLRDALKGMLERRVEFQKRDAVRKAILDQLVADTPFDLPADLVSRQEKSTLRRLALDLRQGGLSDADIRAREAQLRANAHESTLKSLKEFFILAKIAEAEDVKVEDADMDVEIEAIAARTDESARRVRARVEKDGLGDAMASQILERKTIDRILQYVKLEEVSQGGDDREKPVETLDQTATTAPEGGEAEAEAGPSAEPEADPA